MEEKMHLHRFRIHSIVGHRDHCGVLALYIGTAAVVTYTNTFHTQYIQHTQLQKYILDITNNA